MRKLIIILIMAFMGWAFAYAVNYPVIMLEDTEKHLLDITSAGALTINTTGSTAPTPSIGLPTIMIIDGDGDILEVNADGSLTITGV